MRRRMTRKRWWSIAVAVFVGLFVPVLALTGIPPLADSASQAGVTTAQGPDTTETEVIREVSFDGLAVIRYDGHTTYLLENEPHQLNVTVVPEQRFERIGVCLDVPAADEEMCSPMQSVSDASPHTEQIGLEEWPGNRTEATNVTVTAIAELRSDNPDVDSVNATVDRTNVSVHPLAPDEDISGSGLTTAEELRHGTDFASADTDRDRLTDGEELNTHGTDPLVRDTSGNGVPDGIEVLLGTDPTNPWTPHSFLFVLALVFGLGFVTVVLRLTSRGDRPSGAAATPTENPEDGPSEQAGGTAEPAATEGIDDPVITDEERVLQLLERSSGRTRQKDIVTETGWSKSKVSRVLSRMEDEDDITRTRIGRENIVTRADDTEHLDGEGVERGESD